MAEITLITTTTNSHGEPVEDARHSVPVTIDKVTRGAVAEGTTERKAYDLVCFVKPGDVPEGLDPMTAGFQIEHGGLAYDLAKIEAQRGFGGIVELYTIKARLA